MEKILYACRHLLWVAVMGSIFLALGAVIVGIGRVLTGFYNTFSKFDFSAKTAKIVSIKIIEIIDLFLVATVAYIAAVGLYKLFINKNFKLPGLLKIRNLNELESKIIGVIVAALAVSFLGEAAEDNPKDLFNIGIGIGAVVLSLGIFVSLTSGKNKPGMVGQEKEESKTGE